MEIDIVNISGSSIYSPVQKFVEPKDTKIPDTENKWPSAMGAQEIARFLLDNFHTYTGSYSSKYITRDNLYQLATSDGFHAVRLVAAELLRRPALLNRLDVGRDGRLDNRIDRENLRLVIDAKEHWAPRSKSNSQLGELLLSRFDRLADPGDKGVITRNSLLQAEKGRGGVENLDSLLATEVLRRGSFLKDLDADQHGNLDGRLDKKSIENVIAYSEIGSLPFVRDFKLTKHLFKNFNEFTDRNTDGFVTLDSLKKAAGEGSLFARQLLNNENLLKQLDGDGDGKVGRDTLIKMLTHKEVSVRGRGVEDKRLYDEDGDLVAHYRADTSKYVLR